MKILFFLCLCIYCSLAGRAQGDGLSYIDSRALGIPGKQTYSADSIASYIKFNFKTDEERARAIYTWVINNIHYDRDSMYPINWSFEHDEKIAATLRRRKGVCENYASLFADIAIKSGLPAFVVSGYTRMQESGNRSGHSWCAVCINNEWFLCDPTWDAESRGNTRYFLLRPSEFIETHIPFDPLWQLLDYPVTAHEFNRSTGHSKKEKQFFNYADSAKAFLRFDSLQQLEASTRRIKMAGIENDRQKYWLAYNQMKIAGIYGESDMNFYNGAVADLNKANIVFNNYVEYRNNRFIPFKPDKDITSMLDPVNQLLSSASKKLDQIGKVVDNFQYDTGSIKERLTLLEKRVKEQQNFVKLYTGAEVAVRERLFYR